MSTSTELIYLFHRNNKKVWDYVNNFVEFNRYTNTPIANYKGKLYNLPFNMNTFYQMWGVITPQEAKDKIEEQKKDANITVPQNLEEQAISLIGKDIYEKLLDGIEVKLNTDFFSDRNYFENIAHNIIYTGEIDKFFDYKFGTLNYRSVEFETQILERNDNFQGNAVVNYTDSDTPYTRIIEHKHFEFGIQPDTIISKEYSREWKLGDEPYYPINDEHNNSLYEKYKLESYNYTNVLFGGRLAQYKYYDMHQVIDNALTIADKINENKK